jgi:hypothetical protein
VHLDFYGGGGGVDAALIRIELLYHMAG